MGREVRTLPLPLLVPLLIGLLGPWAVPLVVSLVDVLGGISPAAAAEVASPGAASPGEGTQPPPGQVGLPAEDHVLAWHGVRVSAEVGFGGQFRPGRFTPVRLRVTNDGAGIFQGAVGVSLTRPDRAAGVEKESREEYRQQVILGSPARVEFSFVIPLRSSFDQMALDLWDAAGRLVATKPLPLPRVSLHQRLWLILRYQPASSPWLAQVLAAAGLLLKEGSVVAAYATDATKLPPAVAAYDGVDLILLDDLSLRQLLPASAQALAAWVERGGVLVITAAAQERNGGQWPWPADFLPAAGRPASPTTGAPAWQEARRGRGWVAYYSGRLDEGARGEPSSSGPDPAARSLLSLWLAALPHPMLESSPGEAAIIDLLQGKPLSGTDRVVLGVAFLLYVLFLSGASLVATGAAGPRAGLTRKGARWQRLAARAVFPGVWVTALLAAGVFAAGEGKRLAEPVAPLVEVTAGRTDRLWQDGRTYWVAPNPGHPVLVPPSLVAKPPPPGMVAGAPLGLAPVPVFGSGRWSWSWVTPQYAFWDGTSKVVAASVVGTWPAFLEWAWTPEGELRVVNQDRETLWVLALAGEQQAGEPRLLNPGEESRWRLPPAGPSSGENEGVSLGAATSELAPRLLRTILSGLSGVPARRLHGGRPMLEFAAEAWRSSHAGLLRLGLEEGALARTGGLEASPLVLAGVGLPLRYPAGGLGLPSGRPARQPDSGEAASGEPASGRAALIPTIRFLALWVARGGGNADALR